MSVRKKRKASTSASKDAAKLFELKFVDHSVSGGLISSTIAGSEMDPAGSVLCLNGIVQGNGDNERTGRRVVIKSLHIRGDIHLPKLSGDNIQDMTGIRIIVLIDKQTNGAQFNAEDVLVIPGSNGIHGFRNLSHEGRFRILKDQIFVLGSPSAAGNGTANDSGFSTKFFAWNFNNLNLVVDYDLTTGLVTGIATNSLHMMVIEQVDPSVQTQIDYTSRCRFIG